LFEASEIRWEYKSQVLDLSGKVALVTGASRGIGAAVAQLLAEQGADIIINYRSKASRAEEIATKIRAIGRRVTLVQADITNEREVSEMIQTIGTHFARTEMYEPVAASKYAGEQALRARIRQLMDSGISLAVVSGDLIEGTITPKLMERSNHGFIAERREQAGSLPSVEDFASAIADTCVNPNLSSGATVFVGSTEW
jgi:3-oxoacyl-[acyl-carrier protein] reductase